MKEKTKRDLKLAWKECKHKFPYLIFLYPISALGLIILDEWVNSQSPVGKLFKIRKWK